MNQQNKHMNTPTSSDFPVKRKRGRPRKDESLLKKENPSLPINPPPLLLPPPDNTNKIDQVNKVNSTDNKIDNDMVGKVVSGVIEGTFDAGYFLSVRAGNSNTLMRGVVFQPGHFTPISAGNDIAPQVKMYTRKEFPIPSNFNPQSPHISTSAPQSSEAQSGLSPYTISNNPAVTVTPKHDPSPSKDQPVTQGPLGFTNQPALPLKNFGIGEKDNVGQDPQLGFTNQPALPLKNLGIGEKDNVGQDLQLGFTNQPALPLKNLGIGEKDNVGHAYEITKDGVSESASESMVDIFLGNETIDQVPQGQTSQTHEVECHGIDSTQLVPNEIQNPNLEFHVVTNKNPSELIQSETNQSITVFTESLERDPQEPMNSEQNEPKRIRLDQPLPSEPVSEPMEIDTEIIVPTKNNEDSQPAKMENNPNPVAAAADYAEGGSQSKDEFRAEECVFPEKLDPQDSTFPSQAGDMNFGIGEVIPPTESHCYPNYVSENENR